MSNGEPTLEEKVAVLSKSGVYPDGAGAVERLETHMSWVFLTADRVYKLKKPVRFPYLNFATLRSREAMCRAEVKLNGRLAPDVYLGVAPLVAARDGLSIGGEGRVVDWLVVMRRLDGSAMLDVRIRDRRIGASDFDRVARVLAQFYRRAPRQLVSCDEYLARWRRSIALNRNFLLIGKFKLPFQAILRADRALRFFLARRADLLAARVRAGRIIEGHGDLRPEHIWLGNGIRIIDCLEFNPDLRRLDPLEELAYLDLECRRLGAARGGERIRRTVCRVLRETPSEELFLFYRCYSATLRARLAIAHTLEPDTRLPEKWPRLAKLYLGFAYADALLLERMARAPASRPGCALHGSGGSRRRAKARRAGFGSSRGRPPQHREA